MKIINYDKGKKVLSVQYNTNTIWEYIDVDEDDYEMVLSSKLPEKGLRNLLSQRFIVGTHRGIKQ